ncbi:MAG: hypothetical protein IPG92_13885 [Flavobacteriales bacterium]|nr:hypothetical protein [Flavobacteriales bacterium]
MILFRTLLPIGCMALNALCSFATEAYISILKPETCGNANGELIAGLQGGVIYNPLTYAWSTGATTQIITGLAAGTYSVTVTDAQGTPFVANVTLNNSNGLPIQGFESPSFTGMFEDLGYTGGACEGMCNGAVTFPMVQLGGTAPFNVTFDVAANNLGTNSDGFPMYSGFCALDLVNYTLTDAFGCAGTGMFQVVQIDDNWNPPALATGACDGASIGSITVQAEGNAYHHELTLWYGGSPVAGPIEIFGGGMHTFSDLPHGLYELQSVPEWSQCTITQQLVVEDLGPGCAQVQGQAWYDQDGDCVFDGGEVGVPGSVMVLQPGTQYAITGSNGSYSFILPAGNYTIAQTDPTLDPYCPVTVPVPFTVNGPIADIDFANNSTAPLDLRAHINAGWARPGFTHSISGSAINSTAQLTGAVEVIITIDPTVVIGNVTPTPTATVGNVLTWQLTELDYFGSQGFSIQTTVPVGTPLGALLSHSISVSSANPDADLSDNTDLVTRVVSGSYDPNDKTALTSSRLSETLYFINEDEWIDYTIRFQNTGTAEAFFVTITDTLPEELDMTTSRWPCLARAHIQLQARSRGGVVLR